MLDLATVRPLHMLQPQVLPSEWLMDFTQFLSCVFYGHPERFIESPMSIQFESFVHKLLGLVTFLHVPSTNYGVWTIKVHNLRKHEKNYSLF